MPQSLAKNLIHLVFSTKERRPGLEDAVRQELHNYASGILKDLDSPAIIMNSVPDHVHILFNLHRTKALADVVMETKRGTSKWIKTKGNQFALFQWQNGYGAFSISQSAVGEAQNTFATKPSIIGRSRSRMSSEPSSNGTRLNLMNGMFGIEMGWMSFVANQPAPIQGAHGFDWLVTRGGIRGADLPRADLRPVRWTGTVREGRCCE